MPSPWSLGTGHEGRTADTLAFQAKKLLLEPESTTATHLFSLSLPTGRLDPPRGQELAQERLPAEDRHVGWFESLK